MDAPRKRLHPTPGQVALAEALARGEAYVGDKVERLSTDRYRDPERHHAELNLFDKNPLPLAPSALLPEPGMALAHDETGHALIIARDTEGKAHIFANACAHRGTRLIEESGVISARKIACPYHAWVYRLDGALIGLPRPETFPGLCKEDHGLLTYHCHEAGGIIWLSHGENDFAQVDMLVEDFDAIGVSGMQFFKRHTHEVAANWKLVIDAFLESYHVKRLHAASIAEFFADGIATGDSMGKHQRFAVGRSDYAARIDVTDWRQVRGAMTFTYHIYPNGVLIVSPDYANLLIVHPEDDVARCRVEDFMLVPGDADAEVMAEKWERSWQLLDKGTFGGEDFRAAALCQAGIDTGVRPEMLLGTLETGITCFHDTLDEELGR